MALTSVWRDRNPRPDPAGAAASGEWDVIVVGAGITGLTTAALLSRAGKSVLVVEARRVGSGTTGASTAKVSQLQGTQYSRISQRHPASVLRQYADANTEAMEWVTQFCDHHGVDLQRRPAYVYATSDSGVRSIRSELDALHRAGLESATWVDEAPLPYPISGAVLMPDQRQVDPLELLDALAADATAHGATIVESARVRRVHGHRPVRVSTEADEATGATVVIATNMPILDRGGFFARAEPARSYGLAFRTPTQAVDGMYLSADSPSRSLRDAPTDGGSLLLVGGNGHKPGAAVSEQSRIDDLRAWTRRHFPDAQETHAWSAQDYVPTRGLPYVGPILPGTDDVLVAGGYSKWGMTNGVAAALALAGRILGGHQEWASAFEPWSTRELSGLPGDLRVNAEVGFEMTTGWIRPLLRPGAGSPPAEGAGSVRLDRVGPPTATSRVSGVERRVSAVCTHLGGVVRWNDAEASWDCPLHGSRFGPDGDVLEGPATCGLRRLAAD
ncbi:MULTISPECIES: FAD-dependent oxidoreductase [unclassified Nocardioides]|uniref:FAD-dependent oxidoreductase n=1 Tax=unclassified Nocardioides TaxID=2615069 RepID=UPI0009F05579|nr:MULTISPECIES: FAD-dependent oxidoreductase [unclassified Nocardioides]GAW52244.1 FAD dependent oxidoreductase [Nocardioides sp. PD653-B2]GAW56071.1 FAD dependent oxidoreductase [Nocardioides sp. PD653]